MMPDLRLVFRNEKGVPRREETALEPGKGP